MPKILPVRHRMFQDDTFYLYYIGESMAGESSCESQTDSICSLAVAKSRNN